MMCKMYPFRVCLIKFLYMSAGRTVCDLEASPRGPCSSQEGLPSLCRPQHGYRQENGLPRNHPPRWPICCCVLPPVSAVMLILIAHRTMREGFMNSQHIHLMISCSFSRKREEWYLCNPASGRVWPWQKEDPEKCRGHTECAWWWGQSHGGKRTQWKQQVLHIFIIYDYT